VNIVQARDVVIRYSRIRGLTGANSPAPRPPSAWPAPATGPRFRATRSSAPALPGDPERRRRLLPRWRRP